MTGATPGEPVSQSQPLPPGEPGPAGLQDPRPPGEEAGRPVWLIVLLSAVGLLLIVAILIGLYLSERDDDGEPDAAPAPTSTADPPVIPQLVVR